VEIYFSAPSMVESTAVITWAIVLKDNKDRIVAAVKRWILSMVIFLLMIRDDF